jgi:hypothetical protein
MKLAVISDIHDNIVRLSEALDICRRDKIETCICCGDIVQLETLQQISETFRNVYLALGNADYNLKSKMELFADNIDYSEEILEKEIDGLKIAIVHHDYKARDLAATGRYDIVFYGHTHTPWEKKIGSTILLNPGEVSGQYGKASFAIFDTETLKAKLFILN